MPKKASRNFVNLDGVNEADLFRQQKIDDLKTSREVLGNWMKSNHYRAFMLTMPEFIQGKIRETIRLEVNRLNGEYHAWTKKVPHTNTFKVWKALSK